MDLKAQVKLIESFERSYSKLSPEDQEMSGDYIIKLIRNTKGATRRFESGEEAAPITEVPGAETTTTEQVAAH